MTHDKRLIEDYIPIQAISKEASREKSVRKGHISTLHLWWARRPLVACRAAVYGALVPASQFIPENGPDNKKQSLGRANAAKFVEALCKYPGNPHYIEQAQQHILNAHAVRLSDELKEANKSGQWPSWVDEFKWPKNSAKVTREDIEAGRAPRPRVLDMFAGGGAIPLEALRLGCEAYALDLNPVAYIIELCTLVYPQKYGKPDPNSRGMTGPKGKDGSPTWGGLVDEVRYWGNWVLEKVKAEIGDLYPPIPDPNGPKTKEVLGKPQLEMGAKGFEQKGQQKLAAEIPQGYLTPVAYLWTRTVRCKNPACRATVPLVRQTWLCKKKDRYVAMKMIAPEGKKQVRFEVVESKTEKGLGFDPTAFSKAGNATCPFCGAVADINYVKDEGWNGSISAQMMAAVCTTKGRMGRSYISAQNFYQILPNNEEIHRRLMELCNRSGITIPNEPIANLPEDSKENSLGITVRPYGFKVWGDIFTLRQKYYLLSLVKAVRNSYVRLLELGNDSEFAKAIITYLAILLDRQADYNSSICHWHTTGEKISNTFGRQVLTMVWDYVELAPFGDASGSPKGAMNWIAGYIESQASSGYPANTIRGSALELPWENVFFDSIITDPPYYDNVPYADISDFFYVWLKRSIGQLYAEHFSGTVTPKKSEAIADAGRHSGDKIKAKAAYENMMAQSLSEANRVLKDDGEIAVVYAHKTTLGWATLVEAMRKAGFSVMEAWPLDTEMKARLRGMESAALASSIFLVARKRQGNETGSYEKDVRSQLEEIVKERVETLWKMGISGADLLIAAVGAGLRAYTRFARVEYANGEEVPAEKFLAEVEGVVLEMLLEKIFKASRSGLSAVDGPSKFYVLWRYTYRTAELDAGEAIVFSYGQPVELDGAKGLSSGGRPLVEKKKGKYSIRDFTERGDDDKLGLPDDNGETAPLIDILHRALWLVENQPRNLTAFLDEIRPDREHLRLIANAIMGTALERNGAPELGDQGKMNTTAKEHAVLAKLLANWNALMDGLPLFKKAKGNEDLFDK